MKSTKHLTKTKTATMSRDQVYNALAAVVFVIFMLWACATPFVSEAPKPAEAASAPAIPSRVWCGTPKQQNWKNINVGNAEAGRRYAAEYGWTDREWTALLELNACESSWRHEAKNSIGCYGIPQACPADKMKGTDWLGRDYRTSPDVQLKWQRDYIKARYGTPLKALEWHYARGWY